MSKDGYGDPVPDSPCQYCTGKSAVLKVENGIGVRDGDGNPVYKTSWEWCQGVGVCGATIDWEKVYNRD